MESNMKIDAFLNEAGPWKEAMSRLRSIVLACGLTEELKWGVPCYTWENANVVLIHAFKSYCALLFVKGALLADPAGILVRQTENVQAARQIRFTDASAVVAAEATVTAYVREAMRIEQAGWKVPMKTLSEFAIPEEFDRILAANPSLKAAFEGLTPGRRRAYILFFTAPKQAKTRESRIARCIPKILAGQGLDD